MPQDKFNDAVIAILWKIAQRIGADKYSEPKHDIVGDEIADMIVRLETMHNDGDE